MRWTILVPISSLLALLFVIAEPKSAHACLCGYEPPAERFSSITAVFSGRALEVNSPYQQEGRLLVLRPPHVYVTHFVVDRVWKGSLGEKILVTTGASNCASQFEVGNEYLVWAYAASDEPGYRVEGAALQADYGRCGLTRPGPISDQDEDIQVLETLQRIPGPLTYVVTVAHRPGLLAFYSSVVLALIVGGLIGLLAYRRLRPGPTIDAR
jgi:hypothetical protein